MNSSSVPIPSTKAVRTRDLLVAAALAAAATLISLDAWMDIVRLGMADEELNYVLLAPVVIIWIAWFQRRELAQCARRYGWMGLIILAGGCAVHWYGYIADPVLWRAGAVMLTIGAFAAGAGGDVLIRFAPAFAACLFLVPILPDGRYHIAMPLQTATAWAAQHLCDLFGMNVGRKVNLLTINNVNVTVAEACNGMRMVFTLLLVCYAVIFTSPARRWVRLTLLAVSPLVAIASNVLRLVPTVWMFGHRSAESAERFHAAAGWVMIVAAFLALMGFRRLLERAHARPANVDAEAIPAERGEP